ncbi:MAG TPA: hypothetical protein VFQ60_02285 [Patescibacteria group bacterium]|nr:hypothetical protein [Patescibacteria group bacterium]
MSQKIVLPFALATAILLGWLSARSFFLGSWINLIPWGCIGIVIGFVSLNRIKMIVNGILYGFILSAAFMFFGYRGPIEKWPTVALFTFILGVIGAGCGVLLGLVGQVFRKK